ncbi:MAG: antibiotic biosynthesis monooxygenase [Pseudomonadota bacterium]
MQNGEDSAERPCYAVIFSAQRTQEDQEGYDTVADRMAQLSAASPGFIEMQHARSETGFGITICYWESEQAIAQWRNNVEHRIAQERGAADWYERYEVRIAKVLRAYSGARADKRRSSLVQSDRRVEEGSGHV